MHYLVAALAFVAILSVLVIVHEWGHFIVARIFKIRVDEFSLGFGPRIVRVGQLGDTEYNIRSIPLGGFVRIAGMEVDEAPVMYAAEKMAAARSGIKVTDDELKDQYGLSENPSDAKEQAPDGFFAHPAWQRALVIFAGPFMSFALGYFIFFGLTFIIPHALNTVDRVMPGSEAQRIGLTAGDRIIGINGLNVNDGDDMINQIHGSLNKPVTLKVKRGSAVLTMVGTPKLTIQNGKKVGALGFMPNDKVTLDPHPNLRDSFELTNGLVLGFYEQIGAMFHHPSIQKLRQNAGGPIFIAQVTYEGVQQGGESLPIEMASITLSLALFNLLPIPILDGGYLLMFFVEVLRRGKRLTFQEQQTFMLAGLAVIGGLFVFVMFNDVSRFFHGVP